MEFIYLLVKGSEWRDVVVYLLKEEAIEISKKYPQFRVEIFIKDSVSGFVPTYNFYENGIFIYNITQQDGSS